MECVTISSPLLHTYFPMILWQRRGHHAISIRQSRSQPYQLKTWTLSWQQEQQRLVLAKLVYIFATTPAVSIENLAWSRRKCHTSNPDKKNKHNIVNKERCPTKNQFSSFVAKEVQKTLAVTVNAQADSSHHDKSNDDAVNPEKYITSIVHTTVAKMQARVSDEKPKPKVTLKSILKHAKNSQT